MKINCDIGERGFDNKVDAELMQFVDIANIACGGHAGDPKSIKIFRSLAEKFNVELTAHLSYPDKENFGRRSMDISIAKLKDALDQQFNLMSDIKSVKLHGALYNDCWLDEDLAKAITEWLLAREITTVIAPHNSALASLCSQAGIKIIPEAFAERRYNFDPVTKKLTLVSRSHQYASIHSVEDAVKQSREIKEGYVNAFIDSSLKIKECSLKAETICIHSDSPIALNLAKRLQNV